MPITLDGTNGITTPTYGGADTSEYLVPVTAFKNRIINGAMVIDQRNAGASITANDGTYPVDRFRFTMSASSKGTGQQQTSVVPVGFSTALVFTSSAATSLGSTDFYCLEQYIEGFNVADLDWGSANAKTVTLSFQVRSSLTGTFGGSLQNADSSRSYPFTYTISSANTWTTASVTISGDTTGTWLKTNSTGIKVCFGLGVGSSRSNTAGAWAAGWFASATGATSVVGTNGATFYITGVQLEVGSTATSFDYRPYGTELQLCQRYYQVIASGNAKAIGMATYYTSSNFSGVINWGVPMRTDPTFSQVTGTNYYRGQGNAATDDFNSFNVDRASPQMMMWYNTSEVSGTQGTASVVYTVNNASFLAVQAEL